MRSLRQLVLRLLVALLCGGPALAALPQGLCAAQDAGCAACCRHGQNMPGMGGSMRGSMRSMHIASAAPKAGAQLQVKQPACLCAGQELPAQPVALAASAQVLLLPTPAQIPLVWPPLTAGLQRPGAMRLSRTGSEPISAPLSLRV